MNKTSARFRYDPESEKLIQIKKDLKNNEDLKRVSMGVDTFHQEINKDFGKRFENDIDN